MSERTMYDYELWVTARDDGRTYRLNADARTLAEAKQEARDYIGSFSMVTWCRTALAATD